MTKQEIIAKVKELNLAKDSYVVFGSCALAIAGIREAKDIDLFVTPEVLVQLRQTGWQELVKAPNDKPLVYECFEAHDNWDFSPSKPNLNNYFLAQQK